MRRIHISFRFIATWVAVTAAGMAISWAGVGDALRGTVVESPDLATGIPVETGRPVALPPATADSRPPAVRPSRDRSTPAPSAAPSKRAARPAAPAASPGERIQTYVVKSGRVVYALNSKTTRLVSATPNAGFQTKVWRTSTWIRVDLTDGTHGSTVIAVWNGHPPIVQVSEF